MSDQSYLDNKYFIDSTIYNCPFCKRNNVLYKVTGSWDFDWSIDKKCYIFIVKCSSCQRLSMHLSYDPIVEYRGWNQQNGPMYDVKKDIEIDNFVFYSVPTSFHSIDQLIPRKIRELLSEADGCLKMNFLTGASACVRKIIYEILVLQEIDGTNYEDRIKLLKSKFPNSDPELFDVLFHIQEMTSDKIHEQSWDKWDSPKIKLLIETLLLILTDVYIIPEKRKESMQKIKDLRQKALSTKKST